MKNNLEINIGTIINEYSNYVYKIVNNVIWTSLIYQDKEEIVSDIFYILWKHRYDINSNLKSYLGVIARNTSYDYLRKNKIEYEYKDEIMVEYKTNFEKIIILKDKIKKLNEEELKLFNLYYIDIK